MNLLMNCPERTSLILLVVLLIGSCTPAIASQYLAATPEPTSYSLYLPIITGSSSKLIVVWEARDVVELRRFKGPNFENFCSEYGIPNGHGTKAIVVVDDSPAIELVSNPSRQPGAVVNTMSHRDIFDSEEVTKQLLENRVYGRKWVAWGEFKKGTELDIQNNAINFQLVDDYKEYFALIQWILNPYDHNYGWITLRTSEGDVNTHFIGDDNNWHRWELSTEYVAGGNDKIIRNLMIDGHEYELNTPMPVSSEEKTWQYSFALLLELTSQWTTCSLEWAYVGSMYFRNIGVGYLE